MMHDDSDSPFLRTLATQASGRAICTDSGIRKGNNKIHAVCVCICVQAIQSGSLLLNKSHAAGDISICGVVTNLLPVQAGRNLELRGKCSHSHNT